MTFEFGDVLIVPFPFTDQSTVKFRPAAVISSSDYNRSRNDVILLAITSRLRPEPIFGDLVLKDWEAAGLLRPSAIKPSISTFDIGLIKSRVGQLLQTDAEELRRLARSFIG